jgi:hypothetical protein
LDPVHPASFYKPQLPHLSWAHGRDLVNNEDSESKEWGEPVATLNSAVSVEEIVGMGHTNFLVKVEVVWVQDPLDQHIE